jgi:hypothetical protein
MAVYKWVIYLYQLKKGFKKIYRNNEIGYGDLIFYWGFEPPLPKLSHHTETVNETSVYFQSI